MPDATHYTYRVAWSVEDGEQIATVAEFPSLSWLVVRVPCAASPSPCPRSRRTACESQPAGVGPVTHRHRRWRSLRAPFGAVAQLLTIAVVSMQIWVFCLIFAAWQYLAVVRDESRSCAQRPDDPGAAAGTRQRRDRTMSA